MNPVAAHELSVAVIGPDPVSVEALTLVLAGDGVLVDDTAPRVVLAVRPDERTWRRAADTSAPVVAVVEGEPTGEELVALLRHGALGVVAAGDSEADLAAALGVVAAGGAALSPARVRRLAGALRAGATRAAAVELTARERDVLCAIDAGASVKQTAHELGISPRTVDNIQRFLFRKLGVRNRVQAIARGHALGLLGRPTPSEGSH